MPVISVIMPSFNHGRYLLDSVKGILNQTLSDWELIIIDDCSSDDSANLARTLAAQDNRIQAVVNRTNVGPSKTRNSGMRMARGEFIAFCDADDIWNPDKLSTQIELLRENANCGLTFSDSEIIDSVGMSTGENFSERHLIPANTSGDYYEALLDKNFINTQTVLMRKECLKKCGYFDEDIRCVEDWFYWIKIARKFPFVYSPEALANYRVHDQNTAVKNPRLYRICRVKIFRRICEDNPSLSRRLKTRILYRLGSDLCGLKKKRLGRKVLAKAAVGGLSDVRSWGNLMRSIVRILQFAI